MIKIIYLPIMKTSRSQFKYLVRFMEKYGDLDTFKSRNQKREAWESLITTLNRDVTGECKDMKCWEKVWSNLKDNVKRKAAIIVKRKAAIIDQAATSTSCRPACLVLNDLEQRVLKIIESQAATGHQNLVNAGLETSSPACDASPSVSMELSTTNRLKASERSHILTLKRIVPYAAASPEISQPTSTPGPTESPQCDAESPQCDTGSPQYDTESPQCDTGSPQCDTGLPRCDTGSPQCDTGSPQCDTGLPRCDTGSPQCDTESPRAIRRCLVSRQRRPSPYLNTARWRHVIGQSRVDGLSAQLRLMEQRLNFLTQEIASDHNGQRERELEKRRMEREERIAEWEQRNKETVQWQTLMGRFLNIIEKSVNKST